MSRWVGGRGWNFDWPGGTVDTSLDQRACTAAGSNNTLSEIPTEKSTLSQCLTPDSALRREIKQLPLSLLLTAVNKTRTHPLPPGTVVLVAVGVLTAPFVVQ